MKIKKIPYHLLVIALMAGASLILGFLSFTGIFVIWPILPLAFLAFALSVSYEGEIYLQNIKGALNKLFKKDYLKRQLAKEFLLENHAIFVTNSTCPQFFKDYKKQLTLLNKLLTAKELNKHDKKIKKHIQKTLTDMEKWFAEQLFLVKIYKKADKAPLLNQQQFADYQQQLQQCLATTLAENVQKQQHTLRRRSRIFFGIKLFSLLSAVFMGLGTTYLLVGAFSAIPFILTVLPFAFWPIAIIPMAVVAGIAWGLLTYNAMTDFCSNNTVIQAIHSCRSKGLSIRKVIMIITMIILILLAAGLTICTAGTWWTIATQAQPLWGWMVKIPSVVMGIINPMVIGLSALVFNLQNTGETLGLIDNQLDQIENIMYDGYDKMRKAVKKLGRQENLLQLINPIRLLIKLTFTPLRILFFLGHLVSIAATADRVPGVSQTISMLLGFITEGFEDGHYFFGHSHDHDHHHQHEDAEHSVHQHHQHEFKALLAERLGTAHSHDHSADLPTRTLKLLFTPAFKLAALWDSWASQLNTNPNHVLTFKQAYRKQQGKSMTNIEPVALAWEINPSHAWQMQHAVYCIERFKQKHFNGHFLINRDLANQKEEELNELQNELKELTNEQDTVQWLNQRNSSSSQPIFGQQRISLFSKQQTSTQTFLEQLPNRISIPLTQQVACELILAK